MLVLSMNKIDYKQKSYDFYKSDEWQNMRKLVHKVKDLGYCANCGIDWTYPLKDIHPCVDHVKPLRQYWHLRLDIDNLQLLCCYCNAKKGNRDGFSAQYQLNDAKQKRYFQIEHHLKNR